MAGYITKPVTYAYEGEHVATVDVQNGNILQFDGTTNKLKLATSTAAKFTCVDNTTIYDAVKANRYLVTAIDPTKVLYFVENMIDINTCMEYDYATYVIKAGEFVRVQPLQMGTEFVVSGDAVTVGAVKSVTAGVIA